MTPKPTRRKGAAAHAVEDARNPAPTATPTPTPSSPPPTTTNRKAPAKKRAAAGPQGAVAAPKRRTKSSARVPPLPPKGHDVDPETLAFIAALDAYKAAHSRPFPGWSEVLHVARWLGYRKPDA